MVSEESALALVLAGGSQDYLRPLAGHPLLAYSLAAARQSGTVERVLVAARTAAVAAVAREYGAEVLVLPGGQAAQPVLRYALAELARREGAAPEIVVALPAEAPLRPPACVEQAVRTLRAHPEADAVVSVTPLGFPGGELWRPGAQGALEPALPGACPPALARSTRHVEAWRTEALLSAEAEQGGVVLPLEVPGSYAVDLSADLGWEWADWLLQHARLEAVLPGRAPRPLPERVALVVFDFDGVFTDNRVWVDDTGRESVAAFRSDSLGLRYLRGTGVEALVLSMEKNPVVAARCRKMSVPVLQGIEDKQTALRNLLVERGIDPAQVIYLGNDTNDLPCFPLVGCAVAVADALPAVLRQADLVLTRRGGYGAVRELCDLLLDRVHG